MTRYLSAYVITAIVFSGLDFAYLSTLGVPMFRQAGLAIAMGQATDDVKKQAHAFTLSNAEDGVAAAIHQLILPRIRS